MDGAVDLVLFKDPVQGGPVAHVLLIKVHMLAGDLLHPLNGFCTGIDQVVNDDDADVLLQQLHAGVAPDITGAAGHAYVHVGSSSVFFNPIR